MIEMFIGGVAPFAAILQTAGAGRAANVVGTLTVPALGNPIEVSVPGRLSAVQSGLLRYYAALLMVGVAAVGLYFLLQS